MRLGEYIPRIPIAKARRREGAKNLKNLKNLTNLKNLMNPKNLRSTNACKS